MIDLTENPFIVPPSMTAMSYQHSCESRVRGGMIVRTWLNPSVQDFILIHPAAGHRSHRNELI